MMSDEEKLEKLVKKMNNLMRGMGYKDEIWNLAFLKNEINALEEMDSNSFTTCCFEFKKTHRGIKISYSGYWWVRR